jgi:hypothetical protein
MSFEWIVTHAITPFSISLLAILLFPYTPGFIYDAIHLLLWGANVRAGKIKLRLIYLFVIGLFVAFLIKCFKYYTVMTQLEEEGDIMFKADFKLRKNRTERDFYIIGFCFIAWVYVWRICKLIEVQRTLTGRIKID